MEPACEVTQIVNEVLIARDLPAAVFGPDGSAQAQINGLTATFMAASEPDKLLWLFIDLGVVADDPEQLRGLLGHGLVTWASGQLTIALDDDGEHLVGFNVLPCAGLTRDRLETVLTAMLTGAADILDRLTHHDFEQPGQTDQDPLPPRASDWRA